MSALLKLALAFDWLATKLGKIAAWTVLAAALISAGNAMIRYGLNISSNGWLEIQWYLFAAVFMLGAGYAFMRNAHVRIDFISSRFSARGRNWVDIGGIIVFVFPLCYMMFSEGWPLFTQALSSGEMSSNAGGLIRWPIYALIPFGFALLFVQCLSELIKRAAFLSGNGPDPLAHEGPSDEELLAQQLLEEEQQRLKAAQ